MIERRRMDEIVIGNHDYKFYVYPAFQAASNPQFREIYLIGNSRNVGIWSELIRRLECLGFEEQGREEKEGSVKIRMAKIPALLRR